MANLATIYKIGADISDLQSGMTKAVAAIDSMEKNTAKAATALGNMDKAATFLKSNFSQFTAANLAASAIQSVTSEMQRFVGQGLQLPGVQNSFQRLNAGVKQNSHEMLAALQAGTRGMVSNFDLMTQANKAMLLGLPVTSESMGELAKTATILGKAMGQDATKSLDDLITALGRSSPMILDNLGLTVKVGEANEAYAAKLGTTVEQLTDAEKKMAFYEAAMEAARKKTSELGEQTKTLGEIATTAWTQVGNVVAATSSAINVGVGRAVSSGVGFVQFLQNSITYGVGSAAVMSDLSQQIENHSKKVAADVVLTTQATKGADDFASVVKRLRTEIAELTPAQVANIQAGRDLGKTNKEIADALSKVAGSVKVTEAHLNLLTVSTKAGATATRDLAKEANALADRVDRARQAHINNDVALRHQINALQDYIKAQRVAKQLIDVYVPALETLQERLNRLRAAQMSLVPALQAVNDKLAEQQRITHGFIEQAIDGINRHAEAVSRYGQLVMRVGDQIGGVAGSIVSSVGSAIDAFGQLMKVGVTTYEKIATAANGAMQVMASTGGTRTQNVAGGAAGGFASGAAIGTMINPGAGTLIGGAIGAGVGALVGWFRQTRDYKDAKSMVDAFEQSLANTFTATERLAMGNEEWRLTVTAVNKAYLDAGKTTGEAEAAVQKLWASSKLGGDAVALSILEIQAVMEQAATKQNELAATQVDNARAVEEATSGVRDRINGLTAEYNSLWDSIKDEAPEEVMGQVEAATRLRMMAVADEREHAISELQALTDSLSMGFDEILSKLDQFIDRLGSIPPVRIQTSLTHHDGTEQLEGFAGGSGGIRDFGRGTLAMLHGREGVFTESQMRGMAGGGTTVVHTHLHLDGREIAVNVTEHQSKTWRMRNPVSAA